MASSPRQRQRPPGWRRLPPKARVSGGIPWLWLAITILLYLSIGLLLAAFPVPFWVWYIALGGVLGQAIALAGPKALSRFRWWSANVLVLLAILGTAAVAVALGISMGFVGTENLDDVEMQSTTFEVLRISLLPVLVSAIGAIVAAETGDRLLATLQRWQTTLVLAVTCMMGLGLGAAISLLVVA
ncbi:MAG: hypothetical protein AAF827_11910 [Cyanobacteria bacterium P01_D01_bin.6]